MAATSKKTPKDDSTETWRLLSEAYREGTPAAFDRLLARPTIASYPFHRCHVAGITGDASYLEGATLAEIDALTSIGMQQHSVLGWAIVCDHPAIIRALIDRGAKLDGMLDLAIERKRDALALELLDRGVALTSRTIGRLGSRTSEPLLDRLIAAGLDLGDPDSGLGAWIGGESNLTTLERMAHIQRLVARGFKLDAVAVREILEGLHPEVAATEDLGAVLVAYARTRGTLVPDRALISFALDRLPLAAVQGLDVPIPPTTTIRAKAVEASAKKAWLAAGGNNTSNTGGPLGWEDFARLEGGDLSVDRIVAQVVGETLFPELPPELSFETSIEDEDQPAIHVLGTSDDGRIDYEVQYFQGPAYDEAYQALGTALFKALVKAITARHGKPTGPAKRKAWQAGGAIEVSVHSGHHDRPRTTVRVTVERS